MTSTTIEKMPRRKSAKFCNYCKNVVRGERCNCRGSKRSSKSKRRG